MPDTPFPLGRRQEHDPRSRQFGAVLSPELRSVTHRIPPVHHRLDQQGNSCEGNACSHILGSKPHHRPFGHYFTEPETIERQTLATQLDQFPGNLPEVDEGTSNLGMAKAAKWRGEIVSYEWAFGLNEALSALIHKPLLIGIPWDEANFDVDEDGFIREGGDEVGGHAIEVFSLNLRGAYIRILNSWKGWGNGQTAKMRIDAFGAKLRRGGEVTTFTV